MDFIKKIAEIFILIKGKKINAVGGILIVTGLTGMSSPYWYPLVEDIIRSSLNMALNTEEYTRSNIELVISVSSILLGVFLIIYNRLLEHKESLHSKEQESKSSVLKLLHSNKLESKPAFEASDSGEITINSSKVSGYSRVADAKSRGRVRVIDTDVER